MNQKWNLQDIRPVEPRPKRKVLSEQGSGAAAANQSQAYDATETLPITDGREKKRRHLYFGAAIVVLCVVAVVGISTLMKGADITIYPRVQQPNLNALITAYAEPRNNELSYELMRLEATAEDQVTAQGEQEEETTAAGRLVIYNENTAAQRLVANTRFSSPQGNIYRIAEEITIPPATEQDGEVVPGSVTASVTADGVGEQYNVSDTVRFSIPGFAEGGFDQLYNSVYAENDGPITGGFVGTRFVIDDDDRRTARQALQIELRNELLAQVDAVRPAGTVYYRDAVTFTFSELPAKEYTDGLATIHEQAVLYVPLFQQDDLASYLAEATVSGYRGESIRIDNYNSLSFAYEDISSNADLSQFESITFTMSGRPQLIWTFDEDELKRDLAAEHKDSLRLILAEYPAIERAEAKIQPFWHRHFPNNVELLTILEVVE